MPREPATGGAGMPSSRRSRGCGDRSAPGGSARTGTRGARSSPVASRPPSTRATALSRSSRWGDPYSPAYDRGLMRRLPSPRPTGTRPWMSLRPRARVAPPSPSTMHPPTRTISDRTSRSPPPSTNWSWANLAAARSDSRVAGAQGSPRWSGCSTSACVAPTRTSSSSMSGHTRAIRCAARFLRRSSTACARSGGSTVRRGAHGARALPCGAASSTRGQGSRSRAWSPARRRPS